MTREDPEYVRRLEAVVRAARDFMWREDGRVDALAEMDSAFDALLCPRCGEWEWPHCAERKP